MLSEASIFDTFRIFQLNLTRLVWSPTRTVFFGSHIFHVLRYTFTVISIFKRPNAEPAQQHSVFLDSRFSEAFFFQSSVRLNVGLRRQRMPCRNVCTETDYSNS